MVTIVDEGMSIYEINNQNKGINFFLFVAWRLVYAPISNDQTPWPPFDW